MSKREEERKVLEKEAEEAKRKRLQKGEERKKLEQEIDAKDEEFEKKMEQIRKKKRREREVPNLLKTTIKYGKRKKGILKKNKN